MRPLNILRIIPSVDPRYGGPAEGLRASALAMAGDGHRTEVVTLDAPGSGVLPDYPFPVHAQAAWMRRYGYTPRLGRWVAENGGRFDAAVIHGLWSHASVGGWRGLRRAGLPYLVFAHGMMDPWFRRAYPLKHWGKQAFWLAAQGRVLRDAAAVLFTCEEERRLARGVFRGFGYRETVVAYGAGEPPPADPAQGAAFQTQVPGLGERRYLLFLSRLHAKKGCDLLVRAFAKVASLDPSLDLVLAGPDEGGLAGRLREIAREAGLADRLHLPGMLSGPAKWGAFRNADAFVLPSHQENFGIVVAEAMACGTPVLITDKVNIWREVEAGEGGLIRPDTLAGVEALLRDWLGLSGEAKRAAGLAARRTFERHFQIAAAARDLTAALQDASATADRR